MSHHVLSRFIKGNFDEFPFAWTAYEDLNLLKLSNGSFLNVQHLGYHIAEKKAFLEHNIEFIEEETLLQRNMKRLNLLLSCESNVLSRGKCNSKGAYGKYT